MPEIGLRAPARMLVAVRAIVPVTLMPPNRAEATLARPCATSSMFERCLRPVMPSATLADSRLSTPPSRVKDERRRQHFENQVAYEIGGRRGTGKPCGMPPNRLPIVSTGRWNSQAATAASTTAISMPGQFGAKRRSSEDQRRPSQRRRRARPD